MPDAISVGALRSNIIILSTGDLKSASNLFSIVKPYSIVNIKSSPVTSGNNAFLLNKGGFGSDRAGFNLNYGIWLNNREQVGGGFETSSGDDNYITSQGTYANGVWHNAILTFDEKTHLLKLYMDGLEVATNATKTGITPDTTGKQTIRLGANSLAEKEKINGNYTGQLDDIQVWNFAFTKEQVADLYAKESKLAR